MGKRTHKDAELASEAASTSKRLRASESPAPPSAKDAVAGKVKKSKKDKKDKISNGEDLSPEAIAKAERKAEKKAKRKAEKAAAKAASKDSEGQANGDATEADEQLLAKAAKKARKAQRKAEKLKSATEASDTAPSTVVAGTPNSSDAQSKAESSVTSPEPADTEDSASGYKQHEKLSRLAQTEIDSFLTSKTIRILDGKGTQNSHRPITSFDYLPSLGQISKTSFAAFAAPTPIQAAAWPYLFSDRDVIGVAETGSGKTLAFGVPCIRKISSLPKNQRKGVKAVIVSPTRELACQIHEQLVKIAGPAGLNVVCVYGGVPKESQREELKRSQIVVATPGRLNDLVNEGSANLSAAEFVCLDEADRMLDKGFEQDIRTIISSTSQSGSRQTVMFTATWPQSVQKLASTFMKNPVQISIGHNDSGDLQANVRIQQIVEVMDPMAKNGRLVQVLREHQSGKNKNDKILVFCLYKKEATRIEGFIRSKGFKVAGIHGDLSQVQRTASLEAFKKGDVPLLVATDVAARGLDIPAVKLVLNVTFPLTAEDYVHRIGRTGRAGEMGKSITFFTEHEKHLSGALINVLKGANQEVPEDLLKFGTTVKKKQHDAYGAFFKDTDSMKTATKITFD